MIASLFAGISGLNANATAMTVIGDNIANVNTTAFKSNRSSFANVLSGSLGGGENNGVGRGVQFWGAQPTWSQGSLENTTSPTDLAINGKGFFIVTDPSGGAFYTRAGQFNLNEEGNMVNPDNLRLQGYRIDPLTGGRGTLADISIPGERISEPQASTRFQFDVNLDAGAADLDTYSTSQTVYDTLGNAIPMTVTFTKLAEDAVGPPIVLPQTWQVSGTIPDEFATSTTVTFPDGDLVRFDTDGSLLVPATDLRLGMALSSTGVTQYLNWDLVDDNFNEFGDMTNYAGPSTTTFQYQDGFGSGVLRGISVGEDGIITASYSNGQMTPTFQIALADFPSYEGLSKQGRNLYSESTTSGQPMPGVPGDGRRGSISAMAIEMSNVDLAQEFVKMITTQRAFQANSRVITSSDEILQELINIKR